jgi:hypothetical protein
MKRLFLLAWVAIASLVACRKTPNLNSLQNQQVVVTDRDLEAQFNDYTTYHISDTVRIVASDPKDSIMVGPIAQQLVATVKTNMNSRGYTFVGNKSGNPQLGLVLVVLKDVSSSTVCAGWWGGWWGGPWWGWGFYHPWCGSYTYAVGTSVLSMYDLKNAASNKNLRAIWGMTAFGVFSTTNNQTNTTLTTNAINQAFNQSPYIKR